MWGIWLKYESNSAGSTDIYITGCTAHVQLTCAVLKAVLEPRLAEPRLHVERAVGVCLDGDERPLLGVGNALI